MGERVQKILDAGEASDPFFPATHSFIQLRAQRGAQEILDAGEASPPFLPAPLPVPALARAGAGAGAQAVLGESDRLCAYLLSAFSSFIWCPFYNLLFSPST